MITNNQSVIIIITEWLLPVNSDFTLKSLLPVNWQQRIYVEIAAAS